MPGRFDRGLLRFVRHLPFTILMSGVIFAIGVWSETISRPLKPAELELVGLAGKHLASGQWGRIITSALITHGGSAFWTSWIACTGFLAISELRSGTRRTAGLFWIGHSWTVIVIALAVVAPLYRMGFRAGLMLYTAVDVGPSAGFWSCMGGVVAGLPRRFHFTVGIAVGTTLVVIALTELREITTSPAQVVADLSHVAAFMSAFLVTVAMSVWTRRSHRWTPGNKRRSVAKG